MECIINKVSPRFDATQGSDYRLSVLLLHDGFSFLVTHSGTLEILRLASYKLANVDLQQAELGGWPLHGKDYFEQLKEVELTQLDFQKVDIAVASYKFTIAPHEFFQLEGSINIMSAAHAVNAGETILTEPIFDAGPFTAVLIPAYISEYCEAIFPGAQLRCAPSVFVKGVMRKHSKLIARQVFLNIQRGFFEIAVIQGSRLLFLNAFRYAAPTDVLYYVIFVLEQLGFVPSEEKITLMGEISESSTISEQLKMYCESLRFAEIPAGLEFGEAFAGIAPHNYFTLLNIPVCE